MNDPQKKYRLGTVSKLFYWSALTGFTVPTSLIVKTSHFGQIDANSVILYVQKYAFSQK